MGLPNSSCETIFSGANADGEIIFPCSADHDEQDWQPYPVDPHSCYSLCVTWDSAMLRTVIIPRERPTVIMYTYTYTYT